MFTLFVRALVLIWCICCLLLTPVLLAAQPLTALESGFAVCTVPCWAGVEPGRTLFAHVPETIRRHLPGVSVERLPTHVAVSAPSLNGFVQAQDGERVNAIRLNAAHPLWRLLLLLGPPACIQVMDSQIPTGMVNIFWEDKGVYVLTNVHVGLSREAMTTTTLNLWVTPPPLPCEASDNTLPWPGFAGFIHDANLVIAVR